MFKRRAGIDIQAVPYKSSPKEFAERVAADIELWATLTKEAGIERQ